MNQARSIARPVWQGPVFIYLVGWPGVGKYTLAQELARRGSVEHHHLVIDSHYVNNVIFALIGADGVKPLGPEVWAKVAEVRRTVLETIETLSPPGWSFVFTNVLVQDNPSDRELFERLASIAAGRPACFVPVTLACALDELARRVASPSRAERLKWTDAASLRQMVSERSLLRIDHPNHLELDVTDLSPTQAADQVADHLRNVTVVPGALQAD